MLVLKPSAFRFKYHRIMQLANKFNPKRKWENSNNQEYELKSTLLHRMVIIWTQ